MLDLQLFDEYCEVVTIYNTADKSRSKRRKIASDIKVMIMPRGASSSFVQQAIIPGTPDYDYEMILQYPIKARIGNIVIRSNGTELTVQYIRRVGNIQILDLKEDR